MKASEIVILRRRGTRSQAGFVTCGYFEEAEERVLGRYLQESTSEFYFARAVLLVEGDGDKAALPTPSATPTAAPSPALIAKCL